MIIQMVTWLQRLIVAPQRAPLGDRGLRCRPRILMAGKQQFKPESTAFNIERNETKTTVTRAELLQIECLALIDASQNKRVANHLELLLFVVRCCLWSLSIFCPSCEPDRETMSKCVLQLARC